MKLTIIFCLFILLVSCNQKPANEEVSVIDIKRETSSVTIENEWKVAEREEPKLGEALLISNK